MTKKLKIFVSAYACEPNLGSEIGVGWHWVLEMSKFFDLWVLTRRSNKNGIESWLDENPDYQNIHFIYFDLPYYLRFWKKGMRGVRLYYNIWQWTTNRIVKKTMMENEIKIFHHLTYGNALWSVSRYGQKQFFIWGPTGAGDVIPSEFSKYYDLKGRLFALIRRLSVLTLSVNYGFRSRSKKADLILCKTQGTINSIPEKYSSKAILFTDVAVDKISTLINSVKESRTDDIVRYLAVGRLDAWRGFDLLLEAFHLALNKNENIQLEILGKGVDYKRLIGIIDRLNLHSHVKMTGQVSMKEYYGKMATSDVIVNPCLKEGAVTTAFDSMSFSKPLICIETGGYTNYFNNDYAIVVPMESRTNVINGIVNGIIKLVNKDERLRLGNKANKASLAYTWSEKGKQIHSVIENSYQNHLK